MTLIELLVVIIILTTLVSAAIPIMAPTNDDRRLREASRGVNSFIAGAQMKAIELQRPFGVALKRLSQDTITTPGQTIHEDNGVCLELYYVEQPAPYTGFDRSSAACVARHTNINQIGLVLIQFVTRGDSQNDFLPPGWDADLFPPKLIRVGDVIEIDGTRYELLLPSVTVLQSVREVDGFYEARTNNEGGAVVIEGRPINDTGQMLNVEFDSRGRRMRDLPVGTNPASTKPFWTNPASYKILRRPMPTSDEPLQMPNGTALDLRASGVGNDEYFYVPGIYDNPDGILIMFAPEGRVSRVSFSRQPPLNETPFDEPVVDNLFLLVGRRENAPPPPVSGTGADPTLDSSRFTGTEQQLQEMKEAVNWLRSESRWIAIGSQSGRVVTVENTFVDPKAVLTINAGKMPPLPEQSEVLRNEQIKAAREFAREMTQVGGR